MNILGIIAEFNPLHMGHEYLIQNLRRETGAAFCVVVMSGNYVQRGEPAFFSKYLRTKAALLCGADLVLELPLSVSTGSAEYFAQGAVSLLERLHCVTHLGFGSESGDIQAFRFAGELLSEEPEAYRNLLQQFLKKGYSFPKARYEALSAFLVEHGIKSDITNDFVKENYMNSDIVPVAPKESTDLKYTANGHSLSSENVDAILALLREPNNILGTEYMKALYKLHSSMIPVTLKRIGAGYHEGMIATEKSLANCRSESSFDMDFSSLSNDVTDIKYASASGLRKAFLSSADLNETTNLLQNYIPASCHALYQDALKRGSFVTFDHFFLPLYYTLQYIDAEALSRCQDVTPEFAERLLHLFRQRSSITELTSALKAKNLTSTGINRSLLHILLHLTKDAVALEKEQGFALYARILGFRKEAESLLSVIKKNASVPLVSKLADTPKYLSAPALAQLRQTVKASELYRAAMPGMKPGSEYANKIMIL